MCTDEVRSGKQDGHGNQYAYSTGHFVIHDFLSTLVIIFVMLVDTLLTQCALNVKICNTDEVIKCRKCATQMKSSYGRETRNY